TFWIRPQDPYFALKKAAFTELKPQTLYHPSVFVWLPHLLTDIKDLYCPDPSCKKLGSLISKGWNSNPVARRVVGLSSNYYVMTQRVACSMSASKHGCGKTFNLTDPGILSQLPKALAESFPALLTARSGIDKELMALLRAGIANRLCANSWTSILRELHVRRRDILELQYLHFIKLSPQLGTKAFTPFSSFSDKNGYAGFVPSRWYISRVYADYMGCIRDVLDQCMSALPGGILKWDHSFKIVKCMSKIDGVPTFAALFTIVNELEQIRYQAFVPTKSLSHVESAFEAIVASLKSHGLPEPFLGFTDNVPHDAHIIMNAVPSFAKDIKPVLPREFSGLPVAKLPEDVEVVLLEEFGGIADACSWILEKLEDESSRILVGFDSEWDFVPDDLNQSGQKETTHYCPTALVQICYQKSIYLLRICRISELPKSLEAVICSSQIVKIGRNVGQDLARLSREWNLQLPKKSRGNSTLQKTYAALDAWISLEIYHALQGKPLIGVSLAKTNTVTPVGFEVSIIDKGTEVARGVIAPHRNVHTYTGTSQVNVTRTRALVHVQKVYAQDWKIPFKGDHTLGSLGAVPFTAVVRKTSLYPVLQTHENLNVSNSASICEGSSLDIPDRAPQPHTSIQSNLSNSDSESESDLDADVSAQVEELDSNENEVLGSSALSQPQTGEIPSRILADAFHIMDRITRHIPRTHTLRKSFSIAYSDTLFVPDKEDKARVIAVLRAGNLTWDSVKRERPDWLWERVRRYIPQKDILFKLLKELFDCWGNVKCSRTGATLFTAECWKKTKGVLEEVSLGYLSDPPGIPLYVLLHGDKNGSPRYRCLRGTNSVEGGVHMVIRRKFGSLNLSVKGADELMSDVRHRHNLDVGIFNIEGHSYKGHYDTWIDHEIFELQSDILWSTDIPSRPSNCLVNALSFIPTKETFGISTIPNSQRERFGFQPALQLEGRSNVMTLKLSHLQKNPESRYQFLANAQQTRFAVTPVHHADEYRLYNEALSHSGPFCPREAPPKWDQFAVWWSTNANGQNIFYKLPEHLSSHYKLW
ncbi:hypothetical protein DFH11DRAFT_1474484, partial [Phellopilus nigrolimitatus]